MSLLDKICQAFIKMIRRKDSTKHVWNNASPTSTFGAQTLTLDLSDAEFVDIDIDFAGYERCRVQRFKVGERGLITSNNDNITYTNLCYTRLIDVKTTGIIFEDSYFNGTKKNDYIKPRSIWKTKLGGVLRNLLLEIVGRCCVCLAC